MKHQSTDEALLSLLRAQPERGMRAIFDVYYSRLCRAVYLLVQDGSAAEDIAQEVFVQLWKRREQLGLGSSLWAYLRRAGYNRALNWLRDRKLRAEREQAGGKQRHPRAASVSEQLEEQELRELIRQAVDALPDRTRLVFILSRFEGYSQKEIAAELGISVKTVENQMTRALKMLRLALKDHLPVKKRKKE